MKIAPGLDIATGVAPTTTTYTFTPSTRGLFRWFCAEPCDPWAMASDGTGPGRAGYMASYIELFIFAASAPIADPWHRAPRETTDGGDQ